MDLLTLYFREQWATLPHPKATDDVSSKIFMVTGSNVGLGFEASVHLARMRPKLLFVTARNLTKYEQTEKYGDKGVLHTLVANAGVLAIDYGQTRDGWEVMLQVNYLSTALLSILLLPHLIDSSTGDSPSRLVVVSSSRHYYAPAMLKGAESWNSILEVINKPEFGDGFARYSVTKREYLLQVMFIRGLVSRLLQPTPVIACTVSPGACESKLIRHLKGQRIISAIQKLFLVRDETIALLSRIDNRVPEIVTKYLVDL